MGYAYIGYWQLAIGYWTSGLLDYWLLAMHRVAPIDLHNGHMGYWTEQQQQATATAAVCIYIYIHADAACRV